VKEKAAVKNKKKIQKETDKSIWWISAAIGCSRYYAHCSRYNKEITTRWSELVFCMPVST